MAQRRCLPTLTRRALSLFSSTPLESPPFLPNLIPFKSNLHLTPLVDAPSRFTPCFHPANHHRHFSSTSRNHTEANADDEEEEISEGEDDDDNEEEDVTASASKDYTPEEKEAEAAAIGYKVVGPLHPSDRVFKAYEPVFAVVQIGSHQFKVSNGDCIFTERLKFCEVNDKLILNKVLLLGSSTQTIAGRPTVPDAAVHAVVEEHALDAKVIIFKKKRRKNYRRTKGHRQELTQLRITDIQGIEKPEKIVRSKPKKTDVKNEENIAVAA